MASKNNCERQEMDSFSQLPEEVRVMIMEQVSVNDLGRCLSVSKNWYDLVNINSLWKRHCLAHRIHPEEAESFHEDDNSTLCKWAQIWQAFRKSSSYGWQTCSWNSMELDREANMSHTTDGRTIAFWSGSNMTIWDISQLGDIKYNITLPFSASSSSSVAVCDQYIAVTKCNIVVIYELLEGQYECVLALAVDDGVITDIETDFTSFVNASLKQDSPNIRIRAFRQGCLWIKDPMVSKTFIANVKEKNIFIVENQTIRCFARTHVVSWSHRILLVDDYLGRNVIKLSKEVIKAFANNTLLLTFSHSPDHDYELLMETWELPTGRPFLRLPCPDLEFIELHPSKNILYKVDPLRNCITAVCGVTGDEKWCSRVPIVDIFQWGLQVVCQKYLVLFQFSCCCESTGELYVLDSENGEFLYKTVRPPGHLDLLADNIILSKTSSKIYMRTFLNT